MGNQKNRRATQTNASRKSERIQNARAGTKRTRSPESEPTNNRGETRESSQDLVPSKHKKQLLLTAFVRTNKPVGANQQPIHSSVDPFDSGTGNLSDKPESEEGHSDEQATQSATINSNLRSPRLRVADDDVEYEKDTFASNKSVQSMPPREKPPVIIPIDVETKTRMKGFDLPSTHPFALFKYEVAQILECSLTQMKLGYLTPDMKPPPGRKLYPRSLETHAEYDAMIKNAVAFIQQHEIDPTSDEDSDTSNKKSKKGKKSRGRGRPPKAKPAMKYTVTVIPDQGAEGDSKSKQTKEKGSPGKANPTVPGESHDEAAMLISHSDRGLFNTWKSLQEARYCKKCKKSCLIVRVKDDNGDMVLSHQALTYVEQRVWAEKINDGMPGVDNYVPPPELNLGEPVFKDPKGTLTNPKPNQSAADRQPPGNTPSQPVHHPPHVPAPHLNNTGQYPPAPYFGYYPPNPMGPGPYPFPFPGAYGYPPNSYIGYNSNQMPPGNTYPAPAISHGAQPSIPVPKTDTTDTSPISIPPDFPTPLLSEWLEKCSQGYRGLDKHDYRNYLPAFEEQAVVWLLDFYTLGLDQIIKLVKICSSGNNYIHYGTASRLYSYAREDVERAYRNAKSHGEESAWPGYKTVNQPHELEEGNQPTE